MAMRVIQVPKAASPRKHVEAGKRAHVGFLHDILGFRVIAQNAARNAEQATVVPPGDGANRGFIAPGERGPRDPRR